MTKPAFIAGLGLVLGLAIMGITDWSDATASGARNAVSPPVQNQAVDRMAAGLARRSLAGRLLPRESGSGGATTLALWTDYVGSQDKIADWSGSVRGVGKKYAGMKLVEDPGLASDLVDEVAAVLPTHSIIMPSGGTWPHEEYMNLIHDGGVDQWKAAIDLQIGALSTLSGSDRVYIQVGNEITKESINEAIREWAASKGIDMPPGEGNADPALVPLYVEYALAPTVEALREAYEKYYGSQGAIPILMGSIGNAGSQEKRDWIQACLEYEVVGTYAPTLAGKQVFDVVDVITVHYLGASGVRKIWDQWKGVGRIKGVWTTEELGKRAAQANKGAATSFALLGEYLKYYAEEGMDPMQGRYSLWGWGLSDGSGIPDVTAGAGMERFLSYFGETPLEVWDQGIEASFDAEPLELALYGFASSADPTKRAVIVPLLSGQDDVSDLSAITFPKDGWEGIVDAQLHDYGTSGHSSTQAEVVDLGQSYGVVLPAGTQITTSNSLFLTLTLTDQPPSAVADIATAPEDATVIVDVLANDSDPEHGALTVGSVTQGGHGTVTTDGLTVTYVPDPDWHGTDVFTYVATDGSLNSNEVTVSITVDATNDPPLLASSPTAHPNPVVVNESVVFTASASDVDGDALTYSWDFRDGTTGSGDIATHRFAAAGAYEVSVTVSDGLGGTTAATVSVTVEAPTVSGSGVDSDRDGFPDNVKVVAIRP